MMKKILIVDDDKELCNEMTDILQDAGYEIQAVYSGLEGRDLIEQNSYDIIILDYRITGMTGLDILRFMKEKNIRTPVLVSSGKPFIEKLLEIENIHDLIAGVLPKPFDAAVLLNKIKELCA